jgi:hypothetical protein
MRLATTHCTFEEFAASKLAVGISALLSPKTVSKDTPPPFVALDIIGS